MKLAFAIGFAANAHAGQFRKFTNLPYITHPLAVAELVRTYGGSEEQVRAAILHDVVEDTPIDIRAIYAAFGDATADIVYDCTKPEVYDFEGDVAFWKIAPVASQLVKLADIVDNTNDIRHLDAAYADVYVPKKRKIVEAIGLHMRHHPLWVRAMVQTS